MHGPYRARIQIVNCPQVVLTEDDLADASATAHRFYSDATPGLAEGALRCAVFYTAELLMSRESAEVEILGWEGSGSKQREQAWKRATVRRDDEGKLYSTLGSRFNERHFVGV